MTDRKPTYEELEQELKRLKASLAARSETDKELALFKKVIEVSREAIAISDSSGRLVYINPAHEKLFGRSLDEARMLNYREYYPPESIKIIDAEVAPALARGDGWEGVLEAFGADGRRFALWELADTISDDNGRMLYGFGIMRDVRPEIQNREWLREYEKVIEASKDLVAVVDRGYRYRMVNRAFLSIRAMTRDQVIGRTVEEIIGKKPFEDHVRQYLEKCFQGTDVCYEMTLAYPEIGTRNLEVSYSPLRDETGTVSRAVCVIRDATDQKNLESALKESQKNLESQVILRTAELAKAKSTVEVALNAKNEFLYNMSHEFRTPMNHIIGFVEVLLEKHYGPLNDIQEEYLKTVLQSGRSLHAKLMSILELVNLEFQTEQLFLEDMDMRSLLEECVFRHRETAWRRNVELFLNAVELDEPVRVDSQKIRRILNNLISNAVKFSPEGGAVTIRAGISDRFPLPPKDPKKIGPPSSDADFREGHRFSRWFHCAVTDKGIGIRPEDQGHLFEDFGQLDASSKKRFQGIGAGLTLARKFVELHGGRIWVNSEGEGKGATFAFAIPV